MTMTLPEPLVLSTTEHNITVLTLNRPAKRNALTAEMCRLLTQEIQAVTDTANELNGMPTTRIMVRRFVPAPTWVPHPSTRLEARFPPACIVTISTRHYLACCGPLCQPRSRLLRIFTAR